MCRFPAFETGSVDPTAGDCRRMTAEQELLPGNGGEPLMLGIACGYLGTGDAADRPSTAGPADNRPNRAPIRTAGGGNTAVLSIAARTFASKRARMPDTVIRYTSSQMSKLGGRCTGDRAS